MGLTLRERMRKDWQDLNKKKAFFQLQYYEHQDKLHKRKIKYLTAEIEKLSVRRHKDIEEKLALLDKLDPPPRQTGMEALFRQTEWSDKHNMQAVINEMAKQRRDLVESGRRRPDDQIKSGNPSETVDVLQNLRSKR